MSDPTNSDDIIDSRDIIKRIEELEELITSDDSNELPETAPVAGEEERAELAVLKSLADEAEGCADWRYGEALIRDSYFETYAQELAEDCGTITGSEGWPLNCIDWEKAARELQTDYTSVDFDGVTYWIRS